MSFNRQPCLTLCTVRVTSTTLTTADAAHTEDIVWQVAGDAEVPHVTDFGGNRSSRTLVRKNQSRRYFDRFEDGPLKAGQCSDR
jgi:hypothetical protein